MNEENNSLLSALGAGPQEAGSPESSASTEPSFAEIVDANNKTNDDALASLMSQLEPEAHPDPTQVAEESVSDVPAEAEVSEESVESEEELPTESTDDDSPIEDSDDDEIEEVEAPDEVWDVDALKEGTFEVQWGEESKFMTWDQIQNQLNRSRSASEKSREANERVESLTAEREALTERESRFEQLQMTETQDREMVILDYHYRMLNNQLAEASGDDYRNIHQQMAQVEQQFGELKKNKDATQQSLFTELPGELKDYASSKLSQQSLKAAQYDPALKELIQKAKAFDESQKKIARAKPKLKQKKAMTKGSASKVQPEANAKKTQASQRARQGIGTEADTEMFLNSVISGLSNS